MFEVYFKDYKSEPFPLIPLPEQKRIIAILDRTFKAIDQAKTNAEQNLKNAKVGDHDDNKGRERVMSKHGCGTRNDNGERLVDF
jgi:restriction endonuclease S subunit